MTLKTELKPHQVPAVEKLIHIKVGALYMEQGTGKTRTALDLIAQRINSGKVDKVLWLCPCSVFETGNIQDELIKHLQSGIELVEIHGIESLSSSIKLNLKLLDMVQNNRVFLVVDESNLVKNHKRLRTMNIRRLAEHCQYKLILNGTPITKCEKDLFAQWYILDWRILGYQSFWSFAANHLEYDERIPGKINRVLNVDYLTRKIAPYTYQVLKKDCLKLPKKIYKTCYVDLYDWQRNEYERVKYAFLADIDELKPYTIYRLFTALQHVVSGHRIISDVDSPMQTESIFGDPEDNPRIKRLLKLLDSEIEEEKAIIWCKFTHEIKTIAEILRKHYGAEAVELYGKVSKKKRKEIISLFKGKAQYCVANKICGGYGLNLQFCRNEIYYTNDYDYATRAQSEDRLHRIGQEDDVYIYDICARQTIDERILKCLWKKERLIDGFRYAIDCEKDKVALGRWVDGAEDIQPEQECI